MKKILFAILSALSINASYASDCSKAMGNNIEYTICQSPQLKRLDNLLNENYKNLFTDSYGFDEAGKQSTKADQRAWLAKRNACGQGSGDTYECIEEAYKTRIQEICDIPVASGVNPCVSVEAMVNAPEPKAAPVAAPDPGPLPDMQDGPAPFELKVGKSGVQITSLVDAITINKLRFNRGNCEYIDVNRIRELYSKYKDLPYSGEGYAIWKTKNGYLKYGEQQKWGLAKSCNIREVIVETNLGAWTMTVAPNSN